MQARAVGSAVASTPLVFSAVDEAYEFTADDGKTLWASGYTLLDENDRYITVSEQHFENPLCLLCNVAGTSYRRNALQDGRFAPGSAVILRPEPTNPHDPNAVGVWDSSGTVQVGFIPARVSPKVAADIRGGNELGGVIMREFRAAEHGPRVGLHLLIGPAG